MEAAKPNQNLPRGRRYFWRAMNNMRVNMTTGIKASMT